MKRIFVGIILVLLLIGMLALAFSVKPIRASGTIYIRADGVIDPPDSPISSFDNITYTFAGDIFDSIVIERDNIVVDGAGYMVRGGSGTGVDLSRRSNVTIQKTNIEGSADGIYLSLSFNNSITENNITDNDNFGVSIVGDSIENVVYHNNFINNGSQHASSEDTNVWDDGAQGNYWDNYAGVDSNGNGIGDTSYVIDANNQDRYPLMAIVPEFPSFLILALFFIATLLVVTVYKRKRVRSMRGIIPY
jgi:parallel beta-helix repeat protein